MRSAWKEFLLASMAGAGLVGFLQGLFQLPFYLPGFANVYFVVTVCGGLVIGVVGGLLGILFRKFLPADFPSAASGIWFGWGLGLMPFAASVFAQSSALNGHPAWGILPGLVVMAAAGALGKRFPIPSRLVFLLLMMLAISPAIAMTLGGNHEMFRTDPRTLPDERPEVVPADSAPDVILVSIDTLRADAVVGPERAQVPTMDRFRREGLWAKYARSSSNQTLPGHIGMFTGMDALSYGVRSNYEALPQNTVLVSERFAAAGYRTVGIITNGFISGSAGFNRGFEIYDDSAVAVTARRRASVSMANDYTWLGWLLPREILNTWMQDPFLSGAPRVDKTAGGRGSGRRTTDRALHYMEQLYQQERPFYLLVHYMDPHAPYGAPPGFRGTRTANLPLPKAAFRHERPNGPIQQKHILAAEAELANDSAAALEAVSYMRELYLEEVSFVDRCLGEIVARVEASGRPTVILVTADHGEHFGEHDLMRHANSVYEELLQVPFFVWGQNIPAREVAAPYLMDVVPTLLDAAGLDFTELPGVSVLGSDSEPTGERLHIARDQRRVAVVYQNWKWMADWKGGRDTPIPVAVFDLSKDPLEQENLLGTEAVPTTLEAAILETLSRDTFTDRGGSPSLEQKMHIEELGYADHADDDH